LTYEDEFDIDTEATAKIKENEIDIRIYEISIRMLKVTRIKMNRYG
jgi:hypothetical protein